MARKNNGGTYIDNVECSVCLTSIAHESDNLGFEKDKELCKPCYLSLVDNYEGQLVDLASFEVLYLQTRAELVDTKAEITSLRKKIKELRSE